MKTKFYWFALLASAAMIAQANAGGHHGGGGGFAAAGPGPARGGAGSYYHPGSMRGSAGGMVYRGQRFSSVGLRSPSSAAFRQPHIYSNRGAFVGSRQFTSRTTNRVNSANRFANARTGQIRKGNNLPSNWRNHVVAQHSANWHRDWDRHHDHFFHGHRFVFIDGFWFGFDPWWPYWYPYDYYGYGYGYYGYPYGYYPSNYDPGYYDSNVDQEDESYDRPGQGYYDRSNYDSSTRYTETVAAVQDRLAQLGFYRGQIDGSLGPETRRAIERYQRNHGLGVTGYLTSDTLEALRLRQVAKY